MSNIDIAQHEADELMAMEKHRADDDMIDYPSPGNAIAVNLVSNDKREKFILDISRGAKNPEKVNHQERARQTIVLVQLHLGGSPHKNPDGQKIVHLYKEGCGVKWAVPVPTDKFPNLSDLNQALEDFMNYCNVTIKPRIQRGLFS